MSELKDSVPRRAQKTRQRQKGLDTGHGPVKKGAGESLSAMASGRREGTNEPVSPGAMARGHLAKARRKDATGP